VKRDADFGSLSSSRKTIWPITGRGRDGLLQRSHRRAREYRYTRNFSVDDLNIANIDLERGTFNYSRATGAVVFRF
jgi:hypothetical protein